MDYNTICRIIRVNGLDQVKCGDKSCLLCVLYKNKICNGLNQDKRIKRL